MSVLHIFKNLDLEELAFCHTSYSPTQNNEKLEFIGDRVLALSTVSVLTTLFPLENEAAWAKRLAKITSKEILLQLADEWDIKRRIQLGHGTYLSDNIVADTLEAFIGAIYLDSNFNHTSEHLQESLKKYLRKEITPPQDYKSKIQEWLQQQGLATPDYQIVEKKGLEHAPLFAIAMHTVYGKWYGKGKTVKAAEQNAAYQMLIDRNVIKE